MRRRLACSSVLLILVAGAAAWGVSGAGRHVKGEGVARNLPPSQCQTSEFTGNLRIYKVHGR